MATIIEPIDSKSNYWREQENGFIYLKIKSEGTTGPEWAKEFGEKLTLEAHQILQSGLFVPTKNITKWIVIIPGENFRLNNSFRVKSKEIGEKEQKLDLHVVTLEDACLIRRSISDHTLLEAMGFPWLCLRHKPMALRGHRYPYLLTMYPRRQYVLDTFKYEGMNHEWTTEGAFAYDYTHHRSFKEN